MGSLEEDIGNDFEMADEAWDQLAGWLEDFAAAWKDQGRPPEISGFAPSGPAEMRRLALVELVKLDMEYRVEADHPRRLIEEYCETFPELASDGIPVDLLYEEFHIRRHAGESVEPQEYRQRFPHEYASLQQLLQLNTSAGTTSLLAAAPPVDLTPGDQIDDFDLLALLGKGAFASVFLARQRSLQRLVAVKISSNRGNEPMTLAQLDHPNIVRVYDQRIVEERNLRLLYMKYVPGGTLEHAIAYSRRFEGDTRTGSVLLEAVNRALDLRGESPPAESAYRERLEVCDWRETVCRVGSQVAQALDYAHGRGVLHRDLKPANILLTGEALPQLVDFNISFCSKLDGVTPAAYFGGSLAYMSPEQLEACNPAHERRPDSLQGTSDIYSLGVVLWELLTGTRPFVDDQLREGWSATLEQMVTTRRQGPNDKSLRSHPDCTDELASVLLRCLEPTPDHRYATARELSSELRLCLQPAVRQLLRPRPNGWITTLRRHATLVLLVAALIPNVLAAVFNFVYNRDYIIERFQDSYPLFFKIQTVINAIAFPVGIALLLAYMGPVTRGVIESEDQRLGDREKASRLRRRCLRIGHFMAWLSIIEWTLAGMAYPLAMYLGGVQLTAADNMHFFSSLLLCGLVAATYPFFAATSFVVRALYPAFVAPFQLESYDLVDLDTLERRTWLYLALGLLVPMLAVALMVTLGGQQHRLMLAVISASSLAGFVLLVWLARFLEKTVGIFRRVSGTMARHEA